MALDTAEKRSSMMNFGAVPLVNIIVPDGSDVDSAGQRQHMLGLYSGVTAASPIVSIPTFIQPVQIIGVIRGEPTAARRRIFFHLVDDTDGFTPETGEAAGQPQITTDGVSWTNSNIGTLTHVGNGTYYADVTRDGVDIDHGLIVARFKSSETRETLGLNALEVGGEVAHFGAPFKNNIINTINSGKLSFRDTDNGATELFSRTPTTGATVTTFE